MAGCGFKLLIHRWLSLGAVFVLRCKLYRLLWLAAVLHSQMHRLLSLVLVLRCKMYMCSCLGFDLDCKTHRLVSPGVVLLCKHDGCYRRVLMYVVEHIGWYRWVCHGKAFRLLSLGVV